MGLKIWGKNSARRYFGIKHWNEPLKWNLKARESGERRRVFCASMCDILEEWEGPTPGEENRMEAERLRLWELIEQTPNLDWLLLTKRPQNFSKMLPSSWINHPLAHVWLMTTVESLDYLWRVKELMKIPAAIHGISWEPALAYVDFSPWMAERCCSGFECGCKGLPINSPPYLDWIIGGGESGARCRPFDIEWARKVRIDCFRGGAKFFLKQLGGHPDKRINPEDWPTDLRIQEFPEVKR
jgi:protein gp37